MKLSTLCLLALTTIAIHTAQAYENPPPSPLEAFACAQGTTPPAGTKCLERDYNGQTLNNRPIKASVHVALVAGTYDHTNGTFHNFANLTVTFEDPTKFYFNDGNLSVLARAKVCNYHRDCYWAEVSSNFIANRTYGTDKFVGATTMQVDLIGNSGAEQTAYLSEVDYWVSMQQYPIIVTFTK